MWQTSTNSVCVWGGGGADQHTTEHSKTEYGPISAGEQVWGTEPQD
jgi:hypothetical protein